MHAYTYENAGLRNLFFHPFLLMEQHNFFGGGDQVLGCLAPGGTQALIVWDGVTVVVLEFAF